MLSEATQKLLQDVFEHEDLFGGALQIRKRIVSWGLNAETKVLPHSAIVISEHELLNRIEEKLARDHSQNGSEVEWTIFTSRPLPASTLEHSFGSRMATASPVTFRAGVDTAACWVESVEQGWLFLVPIGGDTGWLLSVGGPVESMIAESRLVADQITEIGEPKGAFASHPRITEPLCGAGWLACGTAALGFDPLCGDGTGHAAREAILASAVVRAVGEGADVSSVISHYQLRLLAGFARHLEVCREFYGAGSSGPWWNEELAATRRGLEWCADKIGTPAKFRYRLSGFALEAVE